MKKLLTLLLIAAFSVHFFAFRPTVAFAVDISSIGIATYLNVNGKNIENGDIVIATAKGYFLSNNAYDPEVFGVVTDKPAIVLKSDSQQKGYPVITNGVTYVKVVGQMVTSKK